MARDLPDWGALSAQATVYEVTDMGELAARLGSIVTFDRRGDVLWIDEFERGIAKWQAGLDGTGAAVAESAVAARNGTYSCKLTGGSDGAGYAHIVHRLPYPALSSVGLECSINLPGTIDGLIVWLGIFTGTQDLECLLYWDDSTNQLSYNDSTGTKVALTTTRSLLAIANLFHTFKMVVDPVAQKYVRFIVDDLEFDVDDIAVQVLADSTAPFIGAIIRVISRSGENDAMYVDDVILTQNEPPNA